MKVTALEEYGLRCMVILAKNGGGPMTLAEISAGEGLSISYAGKLLMLLKKAGLVKSVRGRQGGYELTVPAEELKLKAIFDALGEPLYDSKHCTKYTGELENCVHIEDCTVRSMWKGFSKIIRNMLDKISLADLAEGNYEIDEFYSHSDDKSNQAR